MVECVSPISVVRSLEIEMQMHGQWFGKSTQPASVKVTLYLLNGKIKLSGNWTNFNLRHLNGKLQQVQHLLGSVPEYVPLPFPKFIQSLCNEWLNCVIPKSLFLFKTWLIVQDMMNEWIKWSPHKKKVKILVGHFFVESSLCVLEIGSNKTCNKALYKAIN